MLCNIYIYIFDESRRDVGMPTLMRDKNLKSKEACTEGGRKGTHLSPRLAQNAAGP